MVGRRSAQPTSIRRRSPSAQRALDAIWRPNRLPERRSTLAPMSTRSGSHSPSCTPGGLRTTPTICCPCPVPSIGWCVAASRRDPMTDLVTAPPSSPPSSPAHRNRRCTSCWPSRHSPASRPSRSPGAPPTPPPAPTYRPLTANALRTSVLDAALSPDGRSVVYLESRGLFVRQIDGGAGRLVQSVDLPPIDVACAHWLDGDLLVTGHSDDDHRMEVWRLGIDGRGATRVVDDLDAACALPSGDGRWLATVTDAELTVRPVHGGGPVQRFAPAPGEAYTGPVAWAPDSRRLAFGTYKMPVMDYATTVWSLDIRDGRRRRLLRDATLTHSNGTVAFARGQPVSKRRGHCPTARMVTASSIGRWSRQTPSEWPNFGSMMATHRGGCTPPCSVDQPAASDDLNHEPYGSSALPPLRVS